MTIAASDRPRRMPSGHDLLAASKRLLLGAYYYGTTPYRRRKRNRSSVAGQAPIAVLVFHRIADDRANAWTTPTDTFTRAIDWLQANFDLISLEETQRRMVAGSNERAAVAITFDDGYQDNCRVALPLLIRRKIPCTYFVSVGPTLGGTPFDHDLKLRKPLVPNSPAELKTLAEAGIDIGCHTRTHPDLGQVREGKRLVDEIVTARNELMIAIGQPVRYFAFPFGQHANLSAEAFHLARSAGYAGVCSAYGGWNSPGDDPFHVQRQCVDGPLVRLKNWVTGDPLRFRHVPRYRPMAKRE